MDGDDEAVSASSLEIATPRHAGLAMTIQKQI